MQKPAKLKQESVCLISFVMTYNKQKQSPVAGYGTLCHCGKTRSALKEPSAFKALFLWILLGIKTVVVVQ